MPLSDVKFELIVINYEFKMHAISVH